MVRWFENLELRWKMAVGFGLVTGLLVAISALAWNALNGASSGFMTYRGLARDTKLVGALEADMLMARLNVNKFIQTGSPESCQEYQEHFERMAQALETAKQGIQQPERAARIREVSQQLAVYDEGFKRLQETRSRRNHLLDDVLSVKGGEVERMLTEIMNAASKDKNPEAAVSAGLATRSCLLARLYVMKFIEANDQASVDRFHQELANAQKLFETLDKQLNSAQSRELLGKVVEAMEAYDANFDELTATIFERNKVIDGTLNPIGLAFAERLEEVRMSLTKEQDELGPTVQASNERAVSRVMMLAVGAIGLAVGVALVLTRAVTNPLARCVESINALAHQDFTKRCDVDSRDEMGRMAVAINASIDATAKAFGDIKEAADREQKMQAERAEQERLAAEEQRRRELEEADRERQQMEAERKRQEEEAAKERERAEADRRAAELLRRKVDRLLEVVNAASRGDLTKQVVVEGNEPVDELAAGIKKMLEDLSSVIGQVTESAAQFSEGARIIAESSQSLAAGAQTQSSSVEEMSAAVEQLARSIGGVKDNATEAASIARDSSRIAEEGGQAVQRSIESMEQIRASSQQISEIIQVISEIASQTNLLALNAAIEAARAGEHGMGFAVVADEVRKLAERSNQAAREISMLIRESTKRVEEGSQLSSQTGESFRQIVHAVETTAARIAEIASATAEQAAGAQEVSRSIQGVAQVTEQNAAGSEEMASSSEELGAQAGSLRSLVGRFRTRSTSCV